MINQALLSVQSKLGYIPVCYYNSSTNSSYKTSGCVEFGEIFFDSLKVIKKCDKNAYAQGCIPDYEGMDTIAEANYPDAEIPDGYESYGEYVSRGCTQFRKSALLNDSTVIVLADGTILFPYDYPMTAPIIAIDINGKNGPNKWGYDLFSFMISYVDNNYRFYGGGCMDSPEAGGLTTNSMLKKLLGSY